MELISPRGVVRWTERPDGCWEWQMYRSPLGYGRMAVPGTRRLALAHRQAFEDANGPSASGMTVDHTCFNPACVNPEHLRLLTHSQNARNQRAAYATHCQRRHEFTAENTIIRADGSRKCRRCHRAAVKRYEARQAGYGDPPSEALADPVVQAPDQDDDEEQEQCATG